MFFAAMVSVSGVAQASDAVYCPLLHAATQTGEVVKGTGLFFKGVVIDVHDSSVEVVEFAWNGVYDVAEFAHTSAVTVVTRVTGAVGEVGSGYARALGRLFPLPKCRCDKCKKVRKSKWRVLPPAPDRRTLLP